MQQPVWYYYGQWFQAIMVITVMHQSYNIMIKMCTIYDGVVGGKKACGPVGMMKRFGHSQEEYSFIGLDIEIGSFTESNKTKRYCTMQIHIALNQLVFVYIPESPQ
jgi:hypothetical protein